MARMDERHAMTHPTWPAIFAVSQPGASARQSRSLFPFFDLRLASFVWEIPAKYRGPDKRLLRQAMIGRLPESVLRRPKAVLDGGRRHSGTHPGLLLASRPEFQSSRVNWLSAPALAAYIDASRATERIHTPLHGYDQRFANCLLLAQWLYRENDPQPTQTRGETRHAELTARSRT